MAVIKIGDMGLVESLAETDRMIVETSGGTRATTYKTLNEGIVKDAVDTAAANLDHRNTYRGKSLGASVSEAQKAAIQNGTFEDLYIGDYWTIDGVDWMIADMDYWYNCGDTAFTNHHLVIIPRVALYNAQMNPTNTTGGGYVGSTMYTTNLTEAKTKITKAFGSLVLTHKEYLVNAVANGKPSAVAWVNSSVELPNECMMYGHPHFAPVSDGSTVPALHTISKTQLALFRLRPELIVDRTHNQWLRDVVSSAHFARVDSHGDANSANASSSLGVRPVFPIG